MLAIDEGTLVAVDGATGEVVVDPDEDGAGPVPPPGPPTSTRARESALAGAVAAAVTRDGVEVLVGANLGSLEDAQLAMASGADLAGLVRTEFLFLGRAQAPDVDEQEKAYRGLAEALGGRRLTLRTLDVGGDKPLDYVAMPPEANPFLGVRGLRLSLARPALLADQLLAVVRTAHATPVSLMFPMVSTVAELVEARRMLDAAIAAEGEGEPAGLEVGIMVEVPGDGAQDRRVRAVRRLLLHRHQRPAPSTPWRPSAATTPWPRSATRTTPASFGSCRASATARAARSWRSAASWPPTSARPPAGRARRPRAVRVARRGAVRQAGRARPRRATTREPSRCARSTADGADGVRAILAAAD